MANASQHHRHMWIITGPAGSGKTTMAVHLARELSLPFVEGDDYHSAANKCKMERGEALTDQDRWDWLIGLRDAAVQQLRPSNSLTAPPHEGVVVTCSALKRRYRDIMRIAACNDNNDNNVMVHFIFLHANESILTNRVAHRHGHFMKSDMVRSQLDLLEEPDMQEEGKDVLDVDCTGSIVEVQKAVVRLVCDRLIAEP